MRVRVLAAALLVTLTGALAPGQAAAAPGLTQLGSFSSPVYLTAPPGELRRQFVVERAGRVRIVEDGAPLSTPFLDISSEVSSDGERGMLSMAFAPDYAASGKLYVFYTDSGGDIRVEELQRALLDPRRVDLAPTKRRIVLELEHSDSAKHNGGQVQFGPEGLLYIGIGDGGPSANAQDLGTWFGKILRIDPAAGGAYGVPAGNPFTATAGARPEIWSYGLRNPWRFSFDRVTGDMVIADVGEKAVEEVDFTPRSSGGGAGANFGWDCFEGSDTYTPGCSVAGHVPPVLERRRADGGCSITGGYVVRDPSVPSLVGRYLYGDFCTGKTRSASLDVPAATGDREEPLRVEGPYKLVSFGEDACGSVYVVWISGRIDRLTEGGATSCHPAPAPPGDASATPQEGSGGQGPAPEPPPGDSSATLPGFVGSSGPVLGITWPRGAAFRRGRLVLGARCAKACSVSAAGRIELGRGRRLELRGSRIRLGPGGGGHLVLALAGARRHILARHRGPATALIRVGATDGAGHHERAARRIRLSGEGSR